MTSEEENENKDIPIAPEALLENLEKYARPVGDGGQARAYRFLPIVEGLDDFVIRIPNSRDLKKDLKSSTFLTPTNRLVSRIHIGNRLAEFDNPIDTSQYHMTAEGHWADQDNNIVIDPEERITIHYFQHGEPLIKMQYSQRDLYFEDCRDALGNRLSITQARVRATIDVINTILNVSEHNNENPYVRMFRKAYPLPFIGLKADIFLRNILYSKERMTIRMVDQENQPGHVLTTEPEADEALRQAAADHTAQLEKEGPLPPDLQKKYEEAYGKISTLIENGLKQALEKSHTRRVEIAPGKFSTVRPHRIQFVDVSDVKAIDMKHDSLETFVAFLRQLVNKADIAH